MNELITKLSYELKDSLNNDERIIKLNEIEKEMENDREVILLTIKKDNASEKYNDMLRLFKEDSNEVINARKELMKAKEELQSHPLVIKYLKCYSEVRDLYFNINEILFSNLNVSLCPKE